MPKDAPLPLTGARVTSQPESSGRPALQWSAQIPVDHCDDRSCTYVMPRQTPLDSLRLDFQEINTIAQVRVDGMLPKASAPATGHRPRNPLYLLRHKHPAPEPARQETGHVHMYMADMLAYRLQRDQGKARSPDHPLPGQAYPALRISAPGPIALLGSPLPVIHVGTLPRTLMLLAQGNPPFQLVLGEASGLAEAVSMRVEALIPGHDRSKPLQGGAATVQLPVPPLDEWNATGLAAVPNAVAAPTNKPRQQDETRKFWLWGALAGGLLLLGAMATSLLRQTRRQPD